ncbi:MAG: ankyrin repeat domain-containing protein [Richelia sp. RM1_1_1]|nr:ankyrin repeat domain-containing protein [Richelia sp. RM1_1_1]
MPKRRSILGIIRVFLVGFVGFSLINWLEDQARKSQLTNTENYRKEMMKAVDNDKETPLHTAIKNQDKKLIKKLIDNDDNINSSNTVGATPLHYAASFGDEEIINLLINKGANVKATDNNNKLPIDWAMQAKRTRNVKLLKSLSQKIII